jgi:Icc-related predicted phosphoesterase
MWILGDLSLRPYDIESANQLLESKDVQKFISAKRDYNERILKSMKSVLDSSEIPYKIIPGNYDPSFEHLFPKQDLHKKTTIFGDSRIVGYGGADAFPQHISLLNKIKEVVPFDHNELYQFLNDSNPDIILSHNPPEGLCDDMFNGENVGTPAITQYLFESTPKLILSGHIHEAGPLGNNPHGVKGVRVYENGEKIIAINPGNLGRFELLNFPSLETSMIFPYGTFVELDLEDNGTPRKLTQYSLSDSERRVGAIRKLDDISFE